MFVRQMLLMMKKKKIYREIEDDNLSVANEPLYIFSPLRKQPQINDFSFSAFKKISDKSPFNQSEWASLLHVSERTLQRYARGNGSFAPINAERALQIDHVLDEGKITFGSTEKLYSWLKSNPEMAEGSLSMESLTTSNGIQMVLTQLARIQHGILA